MSDLREEKRDVKKTISTRLKNLFADQEQPLNSALVLGIVFSVLLLLIVLANEYGTFQGSQKSGQARAHPQVLSEFDAQFQCSQQDLSCGAVEEGL